MGADGSKARSSTNIDVSAAVSAITNTIMNCNGNGNVMQTIRISGDDNLISGVTQRQVFKISSECGQNIAKNSHLQQQVASDLVNSAMATGSGITSALGGSKSEIETRIRTDVEQMFTDNTITNIINSVNAGQEIDISGNRNIIKNSNQDQTTESISKGIQKAINSLSSIQDITTTTSSNATAVTTNPISDVVDSVFKGFAGLMQYWVIIILGLALIGGIMFRQQVIAAFCMFVPVCSDDSNEKKDEDDKDDDENEDSEDDEPNEKN
jgi:hypothetical protein